MDPYEEAPLISPKLQAYSIPRRGGSTPNRNGGELKGIDQKLMAMAGGGAPIPSIGSGGYSSSSQSGGYHSAASRQTGGYGGATAAGGYNSSVPPPAAAGGYAAQQSGYGAVQATGYGQSGAGGYTAQSGGGYTYPPPRRTQGYNSAANRPSPTKRRFAEDDVGDTDWVGKFDGPLPEELLSQCRLFACNLCQVQHSSDVQSSQHYAGKAHEKKVVAALEEHAKKTGKEVPKLRKPCVAEGDVVVDESRLAHWQNQYQGLYDRPLPAAILSKCRPSECQLCNVKFSSASIARSHYEGKNHEKTMKPLLKEYCEQINEPIPVKKGEEGLEETRCKLCNVEFTSVTMAKAHLAGRQHAKRLKSGVPKEDNGDPSGRFGIGAAFGGGQRAQQTNQDAEVEAALKRARSESEDASDFGGSGEGSAAKKPKVTGTGSFHCEPCGVSCNSQENLRSHMEGTKHARKTGAAVPAAAAPAVKSASSAANGGGDANASGFMCELCKVTVISEAMLQIHLMGQKHKKKMQLASNPPQSDFRCELCSVFAPNAEALAMHTAGKNHLKKLKSVGQLPAA